MVSVITIRFLFLVNIKIKKSPCSGLSVVVFMTLQLWWSRRLHSLPPPRYRLCHPAVSSSEREIDRACMIRGKEQENVRLFLFCVSLTYYTLTTSLYNIHICFLFYLLDPGFFEMTRSSISTHLVHCKDCSYVINIKGWRIWDAGFNPGGRGIFKGEKSCKKAFFTIGYKITIGSILLFWVESWH